MAKRFTDSDKWKKPWFRSLKPIYKCFWIYVCDNCDHAGIWDVDFDLASFQVGEAVDPLAVKTVFAKQFHPFSNGKRWLLVDFIDFQYGELKPNNNAHASVISILSRFNLWELYLARNSAELDIKESISAPHEPLGSPLGGALDMDMDKAKDKDLKGDARGKQKTSPLFSHPWLVDVDFAPAWAGWIEMRIAKRDKPTERAKSLAMGELQSLCGGDMAKGIIIVNQSTMRSWKSFFEIKGDQNGSNQRPAAYESTQQRKDRRLLEVLGRYKSPEGGTGERDHIAVSIVPEGDPLGLGSSGGG